MGTHALGGYNVVPFVRLESIVDSFNHEQHGAINYYVKIGNTEKFRVLFTANKNITEDYINFGELHVFRLIMSNYFPENLLCKSINGKAPEVSFSSFIDLP